MVLEQGPLCPRPRQGCVTHLCIHTTDLALTQQVCAPAGECGVHSTTVHLDYLDAHKTSVITNWEPSGERENYNVKHDGK